MGNAYKGIVVTRHAVICARQIKCPDFLWLINPRGKSVFNEKQ